MSDIEYLKQALELAKKARGDTAPNPAVGAVLVEEGQIIGEGFHRAWGESHAEVLALQELTHCENATLYVTLEPCCHQGRTPPCCDLIIQKGIKKVVCGFHDPNPKMAGQGIAKLRAAGIDCELQTIPEIKDFYRPYAHWWQTGRPFVTAKLAMTLDGKIAGKNGERKNITGSGMQQFTHEQRKLCHGILTTARTVMNDDPLLNVRLPGKTKVKPLFILDRQLSLSPDAKIFHTGAPITIYHDDLLTPPQSKNTVTWVPMPSHAEHLDLLKIMQHVAQAGIHDLWVEAGGRLIHSLHSAGLLNRAIIVIAAKWFGPEALKAFDSDPGLLYGTPTWRIIEQDALCEINYDK